MVDRQTQINNLASKLRTIPSTTNRIEFGGLAYETTKTNLKLRIPNILDCTLNALAALLQFTDLKTLTDSELSLLASIDYCPLDNMLNVSNTKEPKTFKFDNDISYYDVGGYVSHLTFHNFRGQDTSTVTLQRQLLELISKNRSTNTKFLAMYIVNYY